MNIPSTIMGIIGAGIVLVLTIIQWVLSDRAQKEKKKADEDAKIDACNDATSVLHELNELHKQ